MKRLKVQGYNKYVNRIINWVVNCFVYLQYILIFYLISIESQSGLQETNCTVIM